MRNVRPFPLPFPRFVLGIVALVACVSLLVLAAWPGGNRPHAPRRPVARVVRAAARPPLPAVLDTAVLPVSEMEAKDINARQPFSTAPVEVALPFVLRPAAKDRVALFAPAAGTGTGTAAVAGDGRETAVDCLTTAIYYEAASESPQGQRAVAQVVINRMRHPAFPKSICGVVYQGRERTTGCQFSFTCDGSLARRPSQAGWDRARRIALNALSGTVEPTVGTATHYHTDWVVPYWSSSLDKVSMIGAHIFYRWKGYWGHRSAFTGSYAGEPAGIVPGTMAYASLPAAQMDEVTADSHVRPLADQMRSAMPTHELYLKPAPGLRADEGRGTLKADLQPVLLQDARPGNGAGVRQGPGGQAAP